MEVEVEVEIRGEKSRKAWTYAKHSRRQTSRTAERRGNEGAGTLAGSEREARAFNDAVSHGLRGRTGNACEKPNLPDAVAVKVAQVPLVYHLPALIIHPFATPPVRTLRYPFPAKGVPGAEVGDVVVVEVTRVVVPGEDAPFGRYLTPVAGQVDFVPSIIVRVSSITNQRVGREKTWVGGYKLAGLHASRDVVVVPDLGQSAVAATNGHRMTAVFSRKGGLQLGGCVGLVG